MAHRRIKIVGQILEDVAAIQPVHGKNIDIKDNIYS